MKCPTRCGTTKTSSVLLVVAALAGGLLAGAGSGAAAEGPSLRRATVAACTNDQLVAAGAQRTGSSEVRVTVINESSTPCVLTGYPGVALAGLGSPDRNKPLGAVHRGTAGPVQLPVGGRASAELTFTPVLGEAGGYCVSGAPPSVAPSIVLFVAGGGYQLGPDDGGDFALCGNTVQVTAFRAAGS